MTAVLTAPAELVPGVLVRADDKHPLGRVRMLNRHSRLSVLVAWLGGRLEWRDPAQLVPLDASRDGKPQ